MDLFKELQKDIRFNDGLNACINCGVCSAICPAAQFCDYDPRGIVNAVQGGDNDLIESLLTGNTIWYCGECFSCKTRCPRDNVPVLIVQALRALSIETGKFIESEQGRRQLAVKRTVGDHILKYGYCVYIDEVDNDMYPEQGPVWRWLRENRADILEQLGTNYKKEGSGTLRETSENSLAELKAIFDETGGTKRFETIERYSKERAEREGIEFSGEKDDYFWEMYG